MFLKKAKFKMMFISSNIISVIEVEGGLTITSIIHAKGGWSSYKVEPTYVKLKVPNFLKIRIEKF